MTRPSERRLRIVAGLGSIILLCGPVMLALVERVPDVVNVPLSDERTGLEATPIEVVQAGEAYAAGRFAVWTVGEINLARADSLDLLLSAYATSPTIEVARLTIGTCVFQSTSATAGRDGLLLRLTRVRGCSHRTPGQAELEFGIRGPGRIGLLTSQLPNEPPGHAGLTLTDPSAGAPTHIVLRGRTTSAQSARGVRRWTLVRWMWGEEARGFVTAAGLAALVSTVAGLWLVAWPAVRRAAAALGAALIALGLGLAWAVIIPPLQGADEPDHLMSYDEVVGAPSIGLELEAVARRTHFERIRFHANEQFRPADRHQAFSVAWTGDVHAERMASRSPLTIRLWRLAHDVGLKGLPATALILGLRTAGALCFAGVVFVAAVLILATEAPHESRTGLWPLLGLAVIPTLPYFAVMVSDWAFVASWSVLLAASLLVLLADGPRAAWAGLSLGVSMALLVGTSVAALGLLPLVGVAMAGRLALGSNDHPRRAAVIFWMGLAVGLVFGYWLSRDLLLTGYQRYDAAGTGATLLEMVNEAVRTVATRPWLLLVALGLLGLLDLALARLRARAFIQVAAGRLTLVAVVVLSVLAAVTLIGSAWVTPPTLATLDRGQFTSVQHYVIDVLSAMATIGRLHAFDHLTFTSLVSGFGWIDTRLPPLALGVIASGSVMAFIGGVAGYVRRRSLRPAGWLLVILGGGLASATAFAAAGYLMHRNIHGRYLLALYIPLAAVVWHGAVTAGAGRWPRLLRWTLLIALVALHGYAFAFVLRRYF